MSPPNFDEVVEERFQLDSIADFFDNSISFPDLTVIRGEQKWLCHRMVLCMRSDWFQKACSGSFKEGGAPEIEVHDDDAQALATALQYCYTLKIDYDDFALYESSPNVNRAVFYVRVFAIAEKYQIIGLESLAADKFIEELESDRTVPEQLAEAFQEVYDTTSDFEKVLREAVISRTLSSAQQFIGGKTACFNELMVNVPEFAADMAIAQANGRQAKALPRAPRLGGFARQKDGLQMVEPPTGPRMYHCTRSCAHTHPREEIEAGDDDEVLGLHCKRTNRMVEKTRAEWRKHPVV